MVPRGTFHASSFFDLSEVWFRDLFSMVENVWEVLAPKFKEKWIESIIQPNVKEIKRIGSMVTETTEIQTSNGKILVEAGSFIQGENIELRSGVVIEAGAWVAGPTILGEKTKVRNGAYIRGGVLTGQEAVIGHASEVKSSVFFNQAKAAHFAYVGDSILGNHVNLGAGTKISNLKIIEGGVVIKNEVERIEIGFRKMGAVLGDYTQTGCNSVVNPGTLIGPHSLIYPCASVRNQYYGPQSKIL